MKPAALVAIWLPDISLLKIAVRSMPVRGCICRIHAHLDGILPVPEIGGRRLQETTAHPAG
jgi:hypothetical protein